MELSKRSHLHFLRFAVTDHYFLLVSLSSVVRLVFSVSYEARKTSTIAKRLVEELVFKESAQLLPFALVYFKP